MVVNKPYLGRFPKPDSAAKAHSSKEAPMFVHVPQASKNAKKLSGQLVEVVREAKKSNKRLNYMDVCQACRLTTQAVREELGGMSQRTQILIVIGVLVATAVAGAAVALFNR
jgi:hypothetical protein